MRLWCSYSVVLRYDPPTPRSPSLSHPIPSHHLNPLAHIFQVASSVIPHTLSIRLLTPAESPSAPAFMPSEHLAGVQTEDALTEVCAALVAQLGKVKRTGMGWEDKVEFLEFYRRNRK